MARSQAEKAESRARILEIAGAELRARGLDGIGVADLMSAAGMTHGGFYKHFESRENLVEEVLAHVMAEADAQLYARERKGRAGLMEYIDWYLSQEHRDGPEAGCPIAALATDVARAGEGTRTAFTRGVGRFVDWLTDRFGSRRDRPRERAMTLLSAIVGGLVLARAVNDPKISEEILSSVRRQLRMIA
jgi:TetR/AcrR family transcriptional regulator, transcriptional repressor for nem operon